MRRVGFSSIFLMTGVLLLSTCCMGSPDTEEMRKVFKSKLLEANSNADFEGIKRMFCWDRVTEEFQADFIKQLVQPLIRDKLLSVNFIPIPDRCKKQLEEGLSIKDSLYFRNLDVIEYLEIEAVQNGAPWKISLPVGVKEGKYWFTLWAPRN